MSRRAERTVVPVDIVSKKQSFLESILLCVNVSGLLEKEICAALEIDKGHWSNILSGKGHFPINKLNSLMDLCGNEAPLQWLANSRGYGLVVLKSEAEKQRDAAQAELAKEREKTQMLMDLISFKDRRAEGRA